MAAITSPVQEASSNRRRRVRHKIQTPAYASFAGDSKSTVLDLHEIVDISEDGMAIQCHTRLDQDERLDLCLDLADCPDHIHTVGHVVWANESGRAGIRFSELPSASLARLREWLFVNVMAGVANGEVDFSNALISGHQPVPRPGYSDTLAAVTAVQRQVEAIGSDLAGALQFIAERSQVLVRASGAAIALAASDPDFMVCRASSGRDAPPVGARLHVGSGFSGQCVRGGVPLRSDDTEHDSRVDAESCRAMGIRSILAAPIRAGERSVGLIEAFSAEPAAFSDADGKVLQRLAETVLEAVNRAARVENLPVLGRARGTEFSAPGGVLFSPHDEAKAEALAEEKTIAGISLPRSYLLLLTLAAATIALVLGFLSAPWIQSAAVPWIENRVHADSRPQLQTVLASTMPPKANSLGPVVETATLDELRHMAEQGDPAAQNSLGLRYATGDGVKLNEREAVNWFIRAAQQGNVAAQSKLGAIYYSGRGVHQDLTQAYFWMVVARLSGDEASKTLSPIIREQLTRAQVTAIELEADRWLRQRSQNSKPGAGQAKPRLVETSKM
jgi:GAF domain/PilZ domain/Sel1 repeat